MTPPSPPIALACLDLAGTLVADEGAGGAGLVDRAFSAALDAVGLPPDGPERANALRLIQETMGQSKLAVFRTLFGAGARAEAANRAFEDGYDALLGAGAIHPLPGAESTVRRLRASGIRVCLITGFSPRSRDQLLAALGWEALADATLTPAEAGRGRPYPDLVLAALLRLQIDDVRAVAVAGDTAADMHTGCRAGAGVVAGVLTGSDGRERLAAAGATCILETIAELPGVLGLTG